MGVFLGVFFAEPLPLFLPFFFAMATVLCWLLGRWRAGAQKCCLRCACAANVQVPAAVNQNYDDYFPVAAALGYLISTYGYVRRTLVRKLFAAGRRRHRKSSCNEAHASASQRDCRGLQSVVALDKRSGKRR